MKEGFFTKLTDVKILEAKRRGVACPTTILLLKSNAESKTADDTIVQRSIAAGVNVVLQHRL